MKKLLVTLTLVISTVIIIGTEIMSKDKEQIYSFENIEFLSCDIVFADIKISTHEKDNTIVTYISDMKRPERVEVDISRNGKELIINEKPLENGLKGSSSLEIIFPASFKNLDISLMVASGKVVISKINAEYIKIHAATKDIFISSTNAKIVKLSTPSGNITYNESKINISGNIVTAYGEILIDIPSLPNEQLNIASTFGKIELKIPELGKNYKFDLIKNENQGGKFIIPFECDKSVVEKFDKKDTFKSVTCTTIKGNGQPYVRLLTGDGKIEVKTD